MSGGREANMLDRVPAKSRRMGTRYTDSGRARLIVRHDGRVKSFFRRFMKIPETTTIDLDGYGSFVWDAIDGTRSIYDIGVLLKQTFGENVEPLYERLCGYIRILKNNDFIEFV